MLSNKFNNIAAAKITKITTQADEIIAIWKEKNEDLRSALTIVNVPINAATSDEPIDNLSTNTSLENLERSDDASAINPEHSAMATTVPMKFPVKKATTVSIVVVAKVGARAGRPSQENPKNTPFKKIAK